MNKAKYLVVLLIMLFIPLTSSIVLADKAETKEKINFYLFRGEGCPHCQEAEEWLDTLKEDEEYKEYFNVVDYEVWYDEDNKKLMEKVGSKLKTEVNGVPFIVIGKKYFSGFSSSMVDEIKKAIVDEYNNSDYVDVVKQIIDKEKASEGEKKNIIIPIVVVAAIALLSVIGLVFFTKEK